MVVINKISIFAFSINYQIREKMKKKLFTILAVVLGAVLMVSCSEDEPVASVNTADVNRNIQAVMQRNYLWALPATTNVNQDTQPFFGSLLNQNDKYIDGGKEYTYSRISPATNQTVTVYDPGFEYAINKYIGGVTYYVILYVKPGTVAADYLIRGLYITTVNGTAVTEANAATLLYDAYKDGKSVDLMIRTPQILAEKKITIRPSANYVENPLHTATQITAGNEKVGYILYNLFSSGPRSGDYSYENALANKLNEFKDAGVTTLVFDVRYNSGGALDAVQSLGSALVKNRDVNKAFIQKVFRSDLAKPFIPLNFVDKTKGNTAIPQLGDQLQKIYIITGQATAGASEAFVNALKAYRTDVVIVGEKSKGRNIAVATTSENSTSDNPGAAGNWKITMAYNYMADVNKNYDYSNVLNPNTFIKEVQANADVNDNKTLLGALGTDKEIILSQILGMISGTKSVSVVETRSVSNIEVKTSLSRRPGSNETVTELH